MQMLRFGQVLERLEDLLEDLATQCHAIEDMAVLWSDDASGKPPRDGQALIAFQKLDLIAQSLHDLSGLASAVGRTDLARAPVEARFLRDSLRLNSLADRLIGTDTHPSEGEGDGFLL